MKALVLTSGGLDSTTCLALAVKEYGAEQVLALSVYYGQRHTKELSAAQQVADYYQVKLQMLDLRKLFEESNCSLLSWSDQAVPHQSYGEQLKDTQGQPVSTYVPFRNGLFLSCAAAVALSNGCQEIYYGTHGDDAAGNAYPDTSEAFHQAMEQAVFIGSGGMVRIKAPFVSLHKSDVVKLGVSLGVPYELTWSCYEGGERACGVCGTCRDRLKAFTVNGLLDPVDYEGGVNP